MTSESVADYLIERIAADRVDAVFSVTGGGIMYLVDAIARSADVKLVSTHHEEFAGVAADGYARSGKPYGVAFGTTGPGAAHLFTAVAAAYQDSSPVLFIAGQVKSADSTVLQGLSGMRQNGTFEFDTTASFAPITKHVSVISSAETAADEIDAAIELMQSGRPGPVVLEIPLDLQSALIPVGRSAAATPRVPLETGFEIAESLATRLDEAQRPLVLLGIGAVRSGVYDQLTTALAAKGIPYIVTQFGRQAGNVDHPLYLGSPGIKGNRPANLALMNSDLLIAIGTSLHQQVIGWEAEKFAETAAYKIWFEIDDAVINARRGLVDEVHPASTQAAATELLAALSELPDESDARVDWQKRCGLWRSRYLLHYPEHAPVESRMCLYHVVSVLDRFHDEFGAAVTDAGIVWYVLAQHYFPRPGSHFVSSGSFGAMGMALPLAIGAATATNEPVLALTGDGSLMMCLSELATLKSTGLPVVLVVNNNDGYVSIRSTHERYFDGRTIGTDGSNGVLIPRYSDVAATFGLDYRSAHSVAELEAVMSSAVADGLNGPLVVEVFTYEDQAVEPIVTSRRDEQGRFVGPSLADMDPPIADDDE